MLIGFVCFIFIIYLGHGSLLVYFNLHFKEPGKREKQLQYINWGLNRRRSFIKKDYYISEMKKYRNSSS